MKLPYLKCTGEYWQQQRMRCLVRDDFKCQFAQLGLAEIEGGCTHTLPENRLRHLIVHHVKQRQHGGNHDLDNLLTICHAHHMVIHPHLRYELAQNGHTLDELDLPEL